MLPLSQSMRANYAGGVDKYYSEHASVTYRNPHFPGIVKTLHTFLDNYAANVPASVKWHILDMAAGSGEVTEAVYTWLKKRSSKPGITSAKVALTATDPYTAPAYHARTGLDCLPLSFSDIADGSLPSPPEIYDLVICSFALHLLADPSQLWALLNALSTRARYLVVLAPHKKPSIKQEWGWTRVDPWSMQVVEADAPTDSREMGGKKGDGYEIYEERVRLRVWRSNVVEDDVQGEGDKQGEAVSTERKKEDT